MPLHFSIARRVAATAFILSAILFANGRTTAQDKDAPDGAAVLAKVKDGAGLAKVKEKLAADPVGSRFRVDGFALNDDKALKVSGVMLVAGATDEDRTETEKQIRNKVIAVVQEVANAKEFKDFDFADGVKAVRSEKLPHLQLQKASNDAGKTDRVADEVRLTDAKFDAKGQLVITGVRGNNPKTEEWLTAAAKTTLATNFAALTADGKPAPVVLDVKAPDKGTEWPLSPAAVQKAIAAANSPGLARLRVDRVFLTATPVKADETNPTGVSWSYVLTGIALGVQPIPKADIDKITKEVMPAAFTAAKWTAIASGDVEGLTNADNRVPDPGPHFQKAVAEKPMLDGVRIDSRTEFGPDGKLMLIGLQPGLDDKQLAELTQTVRGVLMALGASTDAPPGYRKLAANGVSIDKLEKVKVRELHADLRKWATENLDDVRLNRLYFNEQSRLTLTCEAPDEAVKGIVEKQLVERAAKVIPGLKPVEPPMTKDEPKEPEKKELEKKEPEKKDDKKDAKEPEKKEPEKKEEKGTSFRTGRGFSTPVSARLQDEPKKDEPKTEPKTGGGPEVQFTKFKGGLTKYLQQMVADPKNKQWESVLIERGYFNENNEYTVRGVVNSEEQRKAFGDYLDTLQKDPEWAPYFTPKGRGPLDLEVIPMNKLVERAQRVMPGYTVFDGIRIVNARYVYVDDKVDPGQRLVFDAHIVGRPATVAATDLVRLIAADRKYYGRRLPRNRLGVERGIEIRAVPLDVAATDQVGNFTEGFGALALTRGELAKAREWVDAGLLHSPHLSSVWFLSAYYHHLKGETELVRRDLYRMIELEDPLDFDGPGQRKRRYRIAKDLQGEKRDALEKLWLELWKEYKDGGQPLTFAEPK